MFPISSNKNKFFYKEQTVRQFYQDNHLHYKNFTSLFYYHKKKQKYEFEEIITHIIEMHLKKKEFQHEKSIFMYIQNTPKPNISYIARELNLNYQDIIKLKKHNFSTKESVTILWYLSDKINHQQQLGISKRKIEKIENILNHKEPIPDEIYSICFIKMGRREYYDFLLSKRSYYFTKIIYKYLNKFQMNSSFFPDIFQDISYKQTQVLDNCYSRHYLQIMKYSHISLKGFLITILTKMKQESCYLSLDSPINDNQTYFDIISKK